MACDAPFRPWADSRSGIAAPFEQASGDERHLLAFLDEAERAGFRPRVDPWTAFDAEAEPRGVLVIRRMRETTSAGRGQRWELVLVEDGRSAASGFVLGLEATATLALDWLRGADEGAVWARLAPISHHRSRNGVWIGEAGHGLEPHVVRLERCPARAEGGADDRQPAPEASGDAASSFRSGPSPPGIH